MKTTEKEISQLIKQICDLSGLKNNKQDAIKNGQKAYLTYENAAVYGGYRLIMVQVDNGAHYGAFNWGSTEARVKPSVFAERLSGLITGLEYNKDMFDRMT